MKKELDFIKTRRSRRKFLDKSVPDKIIRGLIDCARHAPSSRDSQPWEFVIIKDNETKKKLAQLKGEGNQEHILSADLVIAVCVDTNKSKVRWREDGSCVAMIILLSAHILGLGAAYVTGASDTEPKATTAIKQILKLPENIIPAVLIPVGYADPNEKIEKKKLREVDDIIHFDKW